MNIDTPSDDYAMDQYVQAQSSFISFVPNEILFDILSMVPSSAGAQPHLLPIVLSHVSQLWRALMLSSPKLWANISVHETYGQQVAHFSATLSRVQQFLERSSECALTVDIVVLWQLNVLEQFTTDATFDDGFEIFRGCMKVLSSIIAPHLWRFKTFNLVCDEFCSMVHIQSAFPQVSMPLLELWHIRQTYQELAFEGDLEDVDDMSALHMPLRRDDATEEETSFLFPRLQSAAFCATPLTWSRFCPRNLRFLEISDLPTQARPDGEVLRQILLANEHSLEWLKISGAAPTSYAHQHYVLSKLERLELGYAFPDELIPFLEDVQLPNLVHLVIEDLYRSSTPAFARQQLEFDGTTALLFYCITDNLPLHQVKDLELRHVCFFPPVSQNTPTNAPITHFDLVIPDVSFEFFCKLAALRNLTLVDPDIATLLTLNHIPISVTTGEAGGREDSVPVPTLNSLRLENFNQDLIRVFLTLRMGNHTNLRRLAKLSLGNPSSCLAHISPNWIEIFNRSSDRFLLAENFEYNHTDIFNNLNVEVKLGTYPFS